MKMVVKCEVCGKNDIKTKAGLAGHMKIAHGANTRKTVPDEIGKRLEALEAQMSTTINPGKVIDSEEKVIATLKLLLPAIEKYGLAVCKLEKAESSGWLTDFVTKYRIVKNSDITSGAFGGEKINSDAKEL